MLPSIIADRLIQRARDLRIRWHGTGDELLKEQKFLEFADGLLRLVRQLDSIEAALARLPSQSDYSFRHGRATDVPGRGSGTVRPARGPASGA